MQRLQDIQHELEKVQVLAPWGKSKMTNGTKPQGLFMSFALIKT